MKKVKKMNVLKLEERKLWKIRFEFIGAPNYYGNNYSAAIPNRPPTYLPVINWNGARVVDLNNELIIPFEYENIEKEYGTNFLATKGNTVFKISSSNEILEKKPYSELGN
jgi:hypothetical protein